MKKRVLAILLTVCMIASLLPTTAFAAPEEPDAVTSEVPSSEPTENPSGEPTDNPTGEPTDEASPDTTEAPSDETSSEATENPTDEPTENPTGEPTDEPTDEQSPEASENPTETSFDETTDEPSSDEATEAPSSDEPTGDENEPDGEIVEPSAPVDDVYVGFGSSETSDGSAAAPYATLADALAAVVESGSTSATIHIVGTVQVEGVVDLSPAVGDDVAAITLEGSTLNFAEDARLIGGDGQAALRHVTVTGSFAASGVELTNVTVASGSSFDVDGVSASASMPVKLSHVDGSLTVTVTPSAAAVVSAEGIGLQTVAVGVDETELSVFTLEAAEGYSLVWSDGTELFTVTDGVKDDEPVEFEGDVPPANTLLIMPIAEPQPDEGYTDSNSIFVGGENANDSNAGTRTSPVKTLEKALSKLTSTRLNVVLLGDTTFSNQYNQLSGDPTANKDVVICSESEDQIYTITLYTYTTAPVNSQFHLQTTSTAS